MFFVYYDESGDDGYPKYSSELFVLTSIYMSDFFWKSNYNKIINFRRELKQKYNFPVKLEFHTKEFLTDKNPYRNFDWDNQTKNKILYEFFDFFSTLDIKIINVAINKKVIIKEDYPVLENAFTYSIQRIENDLSAYCNLCKYEDYCVDCNFLIITDEGRIGKMRKVSRKMQQFNYIPSKFAGMYRKEIKRLLEDPLPKNSDESYFIQIADSIAYIVYLYLTKNLIGNKLANRVANKITYDDIINLLNLIKSKLNLNASKNEYGIVIYPKT
jgi:hypothetical protein